MTSSPPTTSDSLLASARSMPSPSVATVGPSPAEPTSALRTRSAPGLDHEPHEALGRRRAPRRRSTPRRRGRRRRRRPARCASTPWARACATSVSHERSALRPTSSRSRERSTMSSACVPIEPVEPRMSRRRATPLGCHSRRQCRVNAHTKARRASAMACGAARRLRPHPGEGSRRRSGRGRLLGLFALTDGRVSSC